MRYSGRPLPPYRHRPGATPHPERHPLGHMHGIVEPRARPLTEEGWRKNDDYLFAVDLFNSGYFWEAHTFWERLWRLDPSNDYARPFLRGLIQLAAACLKRVQGDERGARKLLAKSRAALEATGNGPRFGIELERLLRGSKTFVEKGGEPPTIDLVARAG